MKKIILSTLLAVGVWMGAAPVQASEGGVAWDKFKTSTNDTASLQNGAKLFVNYCLSCHSASFMRYNRLKDIGLTEQQIKDNLLLTTDKVGETMKAAIDPKQAKEWFGANPPDLTLVARSRAGSQGTGADYLYTFLRTFYKDDTKATGWNNMAFPSVGMPHVLWELQGVRTPVYEEVEEHGHKVQLFKGWNQVTPGTMSSAEFDKNVGDLVNYLQWMGDPSQNTRIRVGVWVLIFLLGLILITWRLNAAFWKDVK
ncbi:cytochrome c1 [Comamonas odontotermitis]|uniref:cytochrome c1 n=1 Tax=Comamonas odontotermitis TaxID=379895 RepID=UPI001CC4DBBF|nr:cytochrome c1 [Comamonas odontotermitis]UBB16519.1 cytochrome c1 [Comamonas odontotermitis]